MQQILNAKFLKVAERVKKSLSISTQHQVIMTNDELLKNNDYSEFYTEKKSIIITRDEFENHPVTQELINSAIKTAKEAINTGNIHIIYMHSVHNMLIYLFSV